MQSPGASKTQSLPRRPGINAGMSGQSSITIGTQPQTRTVEITKSLGTAVAAWSGQCCSCDVSIFHRKPSRGRRDGRRRATMNDTVSGPWPASGPWPGTYSDLGHKHTTHTLLFGYSTLQENCTLCSCLTTHTHTRTHTLSRDSADERRSQTADTYS